MRHSTKERLVNAAIGLTLTATAHHIFSLGQEICPEQSALECASTLLREDYNPWEETRDFYGFGQEAEGGVDTFRIIEGLVVMGGLLATGARQAQRR